MEAVYIRLVSLLLCDKLKEIVKLNPEKIIIAGRKQIKEATYMILQKEIKNTIYKIPDEMVDVANSIGMIRIYEYVATK